MKRKTLEDLRNPEYLYYRLFKEYADGKLTQRRVLYRARVEQVDPVGGQLEASPPNPRNSIRARVYTSGLDANIPSVALNIFHPLFPPEIAPPIEVGEHVYILFEDDNFSNGLWISPIGAYADQNYGNPDEKQNTQSTSADAFHGRQPNQQTVNVEQEYGGNSLESRRQENVRNTFTQSESIWTGKRVLMVGDSMVAGLFGDEVQREVLSRGATYFHKDGRVGWGVIHWLSGEFGGRVSNVTSGPTLPQLISQHRPDIVIISLGGNDASRVRNPDLPNMISRFWQQANQAQYAIWSGPPVAFGRYARQQPNRDRVAEIIGEVVGPNFIDVRDVTNSPDGRPDGVHYARGARVQVARYVEKVVNR